MLGFHGRPTERPTLTDRPSGAPADDARLEPAPPVRRTRPAAPVDRVGQHLRRAFARSAAVLILSDLRLPLPGTGEVVRFDHVLVHRYGLIVIATRPSSDVARLADALRRVLVEQFDPIGLGRLAGLPIDGLPAATPCPPESVPDRVRAIVEGYRSAPKRFDASARQQVAEHLSTIHQPRSPAQPAAAHPGAERRPRPSKRPIA